MFEKIATEKNCPFITPEPLKEFKPEMARMLIRTFPKCTGSKCMAWVPLNLDEPVAEEVKGYCSLLPHTEKD